MSTHGDAFPQLEPRWWDDNGISITKQADLCAQAAKRQFLHQGDGRPMSLPDMLLCQAYEARFDPDSARAFRLAAMIVSRAICGKNRGS